MRLEELARFCGDVDACVRFYEAALGLTPHAYRPGEAALFMLGDVKLFLHKRSERPDPNWPLPDEDHTAFAVDDLDRACAELEARGLSIAVPPRAYDWGRSAYLRDPDGRLIELHQT